ncbi:hypothetical protein BX281_4198 [Streptomyces sp. Ag82_O1-15]|uniref:hypothetical protein n=1 Tax=Streptomyces sp. Ag82_O1-15 TaxID=1938855 RepID=UPI000BD08433|nr:hypothetical protein [Streptomyces sp. Ag82_O1-15]PBC96183.1 hypothetical protein BX281_4174 [Streptomyces sp. Ag82_O1-15]PBC96206.1 hypothetical protein BX281_4198 [Streptomyces sp. Ag82_O1-15]
MAIDPKINPVVAALPGGGWRVAYEQEDGTVEISPLLAWLVLADGQMIPMDAGHDGSVNDPRTTGNFAGMSHPDEVISSSED